MSPELYYSLCNVQGFMRMNGKTYQEHIILILGKFLSEEIKTKISNCNSIDEALKLINIPFTHNYEEYEEAESN